MKKIFLFIILLSVYSFGQENRTVRMNNLTDSLNTIRASIATKLAKSDTTNLHYTKLASKLNASDTLSLSNRINLKLSTADFPTALTNHFFSGQDSLHYGVDSIVITHGVGDTPLAKNISITLNSNGFGYSIWVNPETITSTTFTVRRNDVPTELPTDAVKFNWMIRKE